MLLQCVRTLCKAPGGPEIIWKYLDALVIVTGLSGSFVSRFRTDLDFANVHYARFKTKNQSRSVDAHRHVGAGRIEYFFC